MTQRTFEPGQPVRVTPEYAAWYREKTGQDTGVTPDTELRFHQLDGDEAIVRDYSTRIPKFRLVPLMYLEVMTP